MRPHRPLRSAIAWLLVLPLLHGLPTRGLGAADGAAIRAEGYSRKVIYHSPQSPGYTCWTGAWAMPDGSLMVSFTRATGPVAGRDKAPPEVLAKLHWTPDYDMTGLDLRNVHLRSWDGGLTWKTVSADAFRSPMNGVTGECETALGDGTVLRGVWGYYLPYDSDVPRTGFLQRSQDGTRSWGKPEALLDPGKFSAWPKRLRVLRDGRLIVLGGLARAPANSLTRLEYNKILEPLLMVSSDAGRSWSQPIPVVPPEHHARWGGEEFDAAELPGGDLLCVFRRADPSRPGREARWQGRLSRQGETWAPRDVGPSALPHSGHPELLATREGPVLHLATSGVHWTDDAGRSWHKLDLPGTAYYPRSVQAGDGTIFVFGHLGGDDPYGKVDQSIVMGRFRLEKGKADVPPARNDAVDKTPRGESR